MATIESAKEIRAFQVDVAQLFSEEIRAAFNSPLARRSS